MPHVGSYPRSVHIHASVCLASLSFVVSVVPGAGGWAAAALTLSSVTLRSFLAVPLLVIA